MEYFVISFSIIGFGVVISLGFIVFSVCKKIVKRRKLLKLTLDKKRLFKYCSILK